ncbi:MAG: hypothetical protein HQL69_21785 [Magnetococcales bacterium]|nr:hypothetical protein [Magnetococcales bacterium]
MILKVESSENSLKFPYLFLFMNLAVIIAVYFIITKSVQSSITAAITETTQAGNAAVTQIFVNEVYPELHRDLKLDYRPDNIKTALDKEELKRVDQRVRQFMLGTDILKVKIYNIHGITLYSSHFSQIGDNKRGTAGFDSASKGRLVSKITHRGKFSALDGDVFERDLVASYIPILDKDQEIIGVAEIYTDRSLVVQFADELITQVKTELIPSLCTILFVVAMIVWRFASYTTQLQVALRLSKQETK